MSDATDVQSVLEARDALLTGHFILASGRHSDAYVQCALLCQHPEDTAAVASRIAEAWSDVEIDSVCGPALGGMVLGYEVARALGVRGFFTERKDGVMQLRRGFTVGAGERVLIVEDVVTTAGSGLETRALLEQAGASVVGLASIVNRGESKELPVPFRALLNVSAPTWPPQECPLCAEGGTAVKPGGQKRAQG